MQFDAVKFMREQRDRISREIAGMTRAEKLAYFHEAGRRYEAQAEKRRAELARQAAGEGGGSGEVARGDGAGGGLVKDAGFPLALAERKRGK